jgi:N-acetylmuramoyl-L-alanine amidase
VQEIASLDQQPDRIRATDRPTTGPIAASVAGTVQAPQADDGSLASTTTPLGMNRGHKKPSPLHPAASDVATADDNLPPAMREAEPTAAGERSLVRTLGLKIGRIVIDAGHGGHDTGTLGPGGVEEKEIVLDVALRLGKLLKQRLGADVIFTRDNDTFVPLETRTAIANKAQADLFLSIHANSSSDSSARGVETYYLNFTTSPDALEVAARENAVSDESIHELSDLVKKITLKDKIDESREFATDVQKSLYDDLEEGNPGLRDRGVKKAPFVVLIGANMPSILAEISFLTNTDDARELQQPAYRQRIAESLYRGVARYISGLSGVRLAQSLGRPNGN